MKRVIYLATRPRRIASYLAAVGIIAFLLASCAGTKGVERYYQQHVFQPVAVDSLTPANLLAKTNKLALPARITVTPRRTLLDKVLGRPAAPYRVSAAVRIGKKATVNVYNAPATITTIGKKATAATGAAAKVATAGKNATQATDAAAATATAGGAAAVGAGAHAEGGAVKPAGVGATIANAIAGPLGYVLAAAAAGVTLYLLYLIWAFLPRRKKKQAETPIS